MPHPAPILTPRLTLVPSTAELARAAVTDHDQFAALLGAEVTEEWPPEVLGDVESIFADHLAAKPDLAGWYGWYAITRDEGLAKRPTLVASIGCMPADAGGMVMFGYSVLPAFERRGIAKEGVKAFLGWLSAQPGITLLRADSFERNHASRRILEHCGLTLIGVSPDDATAVESDRQGRGPLLRYEWAVPNPTPFVGR